MKNKKFVLTAIAFALVVLAIACAPAPTPTPVVVTREVTRVVPSTAVVVTSVPSPVSGKVENTPRIAIESAYTPEITKLLNKVKVEGSYVVNGTTFTTAEFSGKKVVLFLSQVSMTNAAMNTERLFNKFNISYLIFSGIAGGVNPNLNVGDVTIPKQWMEYQENRFARQTEKDWQLPDSNRNEYGNFGMMFPQRVNVTKKDGKPDGPEKKFWFTADPEMLLAAQKTAAKVTLSRCATNNVCLQSQPKIVIGGNGVSGPTFVDNAAYRKYVWETFKADALDMETAATAHVAESNGIPYIAFRSLSDLAGGGPGENEIGTFFQLAADNSAEFVLNFLGTWVP